PRGQGLKTYLTARTFVVLLLWQLFGLVAMLMPGLWVLYAAVPVVLALILAIDYRSLPKNGQISLEMMSEPYIELGRVVSLKWRLMAVPGRAFPTDGWRLRLPVLPTMTFFPVELP